MVLYATVFFEFGGSRNFAGRYSMPGSPWTFFLGGREKRPSIVGQIRIGGQYIDW